MKIPNLLLTNSDKLDLELIDQGLLVFYAMTKETKNKNNLNRSSVNCYVHTGNSRGRGGDIKIVKCCNKHEILIYQVCSLPIARRGFKVQQPTLRVIQSVIKHKCYWSVPNFKKIQYF